jgi:hypothetical protein
MKKYRMALLVLSASLALAARPAFAAPDEYDDSQSHPLRILAYLAYPAAFVVEWTVFRPFHYLVSATEPQEAFFGHTPHPPVIAEPQPIRNYGVAKKVVMNEPSAQQPQTAAVTPEPVERVKVVEVLGKGQVYLAAQRLKEKPDLKVLIEGHTDSVGSDDYNQKLGLRRAQTVIKELTAQGIDASRLSATSFGETKPAINQETDWAHAVNRRVEFQVNPR